MSFAPPRSLWGPVPRDSRNSASFLGRESPLGAPERGRSRSSPGWVPALCGEERYSFGGHLPMPITRQWHRQTVLTITLSDDEAVTLNKNNLSQKYFGVLDPFEEGQGISRSCSVRGPFKCGSRFWNPNTGSLRRPVQDSSKPALIRHNECEGDTLRGGVFAGSCDDPSVSFVSISSEAVQYLLNLPIPGGTVSSISADRIRLPYRQVLRIL
jgi:hypothetical protein